jgi:beta-glucanase (GH16 family)
LQLSICVVAAFAGCDDGPITGAPSRDASAAPSRDAAFPLAAPDGALPGRRLIWRDEFDCPAGQSPDASRWTMEVGGDGKGNQQLEYTTARPSNVALDGEGHLAIIARQESLGGRAYTSGRLNTLDHFTQAYGRFEARMQLPSGQGIWPAFWLLGGDVTAVGWPACGEIDIIELQGQAPAVVHGTVHGPGYSGGQGITSAHFVSGGDLTDAFHVYAVEWTPASIGFSVDDVIYFTVTPAQLPAGAPWVFDHPFGVILDVAVGGTFVGAPNATTAFPQTLLVDYVRVYEPTP